MTITTAELARRDQAEAKEREFDRRAVKVARFLLALFGTVAIYAGLAVYGIVPAAPWSAVGQAQQQQQHMDDTPPTFTELTEPVSPDNIEGA